MTTDREMRERVVAIVHEIDGLRQGEAITVLLSALELVIRNSTDPLAGWWFISNLVRARIDHGNDDCAGSA